MKVTCYLASILMSSHIPSSNNSNDLEIFKQIGFIQTEMLRNSCTEEKCMLKSQMKHILN